MSAGGTAQAGALPHGVAAAGRYAVGVVDYDLGSAAYTLAETGEPVELAATVHYPKDPHGAVRHPLVVMLHGLHETCADRTAAAERDAAEKAGDWDAFAAASQKLFSWPCPPGVRPIASDHGYDYLAQDLAAQGFVVVSVSANGINASSVTGDENASARADLLNRHLALWQRLDATGTGQLSGHFIDPATGKRANVDFRHRVDLQRVGTLGHSRGGAGVTWQAADAHRGQWPAGVKVKAVLGLAPAYNVMTEDMSAYRIDSTPLAVMRGSCDGQVGTEAFSFAGDATAQGTGATYRFAVRGANHNFFNTRWSPDSGEVAAKDDASHSPDRPGRCGDDSTATPDIQLTEPQERKVLSTYAGAYFRRYLMGDHRSDAVLEGREHPLSRITEVDVQARVGR
ncbi:alpha/beta hydrolase [Streptomyces sp. NPDC047017]|uniref:alpha/beta hydrolase n=1 Tax=Streptomyces sp. NPDC047017 TaxID=3155024 RepID=UPI0033C73707